jgi:hypothetical protein
MESGPLIGMVSMLNHEVLKGSGQNIFLAGECQNLLLEMMWVLLILACGTGSRALSFFRPFDQMGWHLTDG